MAATVTKLLDELVYVDCFEFVYLKSFSSTIFFSFNKIVSSLLLALIFHLAVQNHPSVSVPI